ncbi:DUF4126 domain-containing protein [Lacihabitans soyangensis]|uniref:DUF4126 domain-containing protein n=1 Tax=Lacihabitans soyangensis TaxID=869394 RepID=A0AAE3KSF2_9BACT|nr:DUF4126 domain-containing protein [Lacihabitans soyangensis]MCP9763043.1 DUF4126 domain-containing protein [Lacihabitans soyangensis]
MEEWITWIPGLMLGVALSAGSGFRVFIPLLVSNLAARFGLVSVSDDFGWMISNTATFVLIVASIVEIASYYIAFIDNLLDSIALPASVVAGTLLTTQFLKINDPTLQWGLGILAGGGVAGTIQAGTSLIRLGSTKFTGGIGNSFFSTFENILAVGISIVSIWIPLIMGVLAILLVFWMLKKLFSSKPKKPILQ